MKYENRIILFLDFLGFKELIEGTTTDISLIKRLAEAIDHVRELANTEFAHDTQRITQFSDSLVVSYEVDARSAVFDLVCNIGFILIALVERGFLVRGAVTAGPLIHTERHLFGPAMVHAYEMESKLAKYPRVIVDPKILRIAAKNHAEQHGPAEERRYVESFLCMDVDGQRFIDYVSWRAVVETVGGESDLYPAYLAKVASILAKGLRHKLPEVQAKYLWLYKGYSKALKQINDTPRDSEGRRRDPDFFAAIASLPSLEREARLARDAVGNKG